MNRDGQVGHFRRSKWASCDERTQGTRLTRNKWKQSLGLAVPEIGNPPRSQNICKTCGVVISRYRFYCPGCSAVASHSSCVNNVLKAGKSAHTPEAKNKRKETMRKRFIAEQSWDPASLPEWLTQEFYVSNIQPKLASVPRPVIAEHIGISIHYAGQVRTGIYIPHRRFWKKLGELVGTSAGK